MQQQQQFGNAVHFAHLVLRHHNFPPGTNRRVHLKHEVE